MSRWTLESEVGELRGTCSAAAEREPPSKF